MDSWTRYSEHTHGNLKRTKTGSNPVRAFMEYKTYLTVDDDKINPTEALNKIREIEGVDIETAI